MLHNELLKLFFQVLNLLILGIAGGYLFYTKALGVIYQKIQEKRDVLSQLSYEYQVVLEKQNTMITLQQKQVQEIAALQAKVLAWNAATQGEQVAIQRTEHARTHALLEKQKKQAREFGTFQVSQAVLPEALKGSQEELSSLFKNNTRGQAYIDDIIHHLDKSNI